MDSVDHENKLPNEKIPPPVYQTRELFGLKREIIIEHGEAQYRLRITKAGKLILNK